MGLAKPPGDVTGATALVLTYLQLHEWRPVTT